MSTNLPATPSHHQAAMPEPGALAEQMRYAQALAGAGLLPKAYRDKPADLLLAMSYATALGLPLAVVLGEVHVVEGKPTLSATLMASLARRAGHRVRTRTTVDEANDPVVSCEVRRADDPEYPFETVWTMARAKQAGLANRGPWKQYPAAMLRARALSEAIREACPEVLAGSYDPDELTAPATFPPAQPAPVDVTAATVVEVEDAQVVEQDTTVSEAGRTSRTPMTDEQRRDLWRDARAHGYGDKKELAGFACGLLEYEYDVERLGMLTEAEASKVMAALQDVQVAEREQPEQPPGDPWATQETLT